MESFPCQLELTVASALLLLSAQMPLLSPPKTSLCEVSGKSLAVIRSKSSRSSSATSDDGSPVEVSDQLFSNVAVVTPLQETKLKESVDVSQSKSSCSSSLTCDDGSSVDVHAHSISRVAVATPSYVLQLKVVRKSRTKNCRSSSYRKINSGYKIGAVSSECASESTEVASCLSTSSSCVSSAPTGWKKGHAGGDSKAKKSSNSVPMRRRADAIMRLLSGGAASEVRIRQLLGDSPDTSKALRMLLKQESVRRSGVGGRIDPYVYSIAS